MNIQSLLAEARAYSRAGDARRAFAKVAQASEIGHQSIHLKNSRAKMVRPGTRITAQSPARIDLSGGWSDTPPYCYEQGGHVVNVAIDLDGAAPVTTVVRTFGQRKLILQSIDLHKSLELNLAHINDPVDLHDPFALHKLALKIVGLSPPPTGGLEVTTDCRVPKGSGLGASSILAATLLAALHRAAGRRVRKIQLIEQTLLLEQRLGIGGGWQDQIGGIIGGIKSILSAPGIPQRPIVHKIPLSPSQYDNLQERLVVYFTGKQRIARNILWQVMGRWLQGDLQMTRLENELKDGAASLKEAILRKQWKHASAQINRYWRLKKEIYSGSTLPAIDRLLKKLKPNYQCASLAGAGGGGFAYFLCATASQARKLRGLLEKTRGTVHICHINRRGLVVSAHSGSRRAVARKLS